MTFLQKHWKWIAVSAAGLAAVTWICFRIVSLQSVDPDDAQDPTRLASPSDYKDQRPAATAAAKSSEVDLLNRIQVSKDAVAGTWGFQDRVLITSQVPSGRLQVPCLPPEEYDLNLTVMRKRGTGSLNLGLPWGGRQAMVMVDGIDGHTTCLQLGEGYDPASNQTTFREKLFKWNRRSVVSVSVRKGGITLNVDGKKIFQWAGDPAELYVQPGFFVPNPSSLFIGTWETIFRVEEMVLVPVQGNPKFLR